MASTISNATSSANSAISDAAQSIISGSTNSSLDVNQLVKALVNAKTAGPSAALTARQSSDNTSLTALGTLQASLLGLQTSLAAFKDGAALQHYTATASLKDQGLSATAGKDAVAGTYKLAVTQLATAQKLSSGGFAADAKLGTGDLEISLGDKSMHVTLGANNNTLAGVAAAINNAKDNPGITAAIVTGTDGQHLILTSTKTGEANQITLKAGAGIDAGLDAAGFKEVAPARDAQLTIDGNAVKSASNTLDGVISGITIQLDSAAEKTTQTLTVAPDMGAAGDAIRNFVKSYNAYVDAISGLTAYNPQAAAGSRAGALLGDSIARTLSSALPGVISGGLKGSDGVRYSIGNVGISLQSNGKLQIDEDAFKTALQPGNRALSAIFGGDGLATKLNDAITPYTQKNGLIDRRTDALNKDLQSIQKQASDLDMRAKTLTTKYNQQFTALNSLMATMNNNQQYLTQLFGGQNSAGALATNHK
jgi:flagellar hook-associated protein 2